MGDEQYTRPRRASGALSAALTTLKGHAKVLAAFIGGVGTATILVFNAGADYQGVKSQVEANRTDIKLLRTELRLFESVVLHVPAPTPERNEE
jgi:hypothetical protein